jgi:hypothetical protein
MTTTTTIVMMIMQAQWQKVTTPCLDSQNRTRFMAYRYQSELQSRFMTVTTRPRYSLNCPMLQVWSGKTNLRRALESAHIRPFWRQAPDG